MSLKVSEIFDIDGKVAIVTGGSRGIGRMIAQGYVENGARVYISSRKAEQCDATAQELSELGHCVSIPADLATNEGRVAFLGPASSMLVPSTR
jgi:NAD(P)-dependent dehydrogenase (short-subunit alcohol dehydrogenase family)